MSRISLNHVTDPSEMAGAVLYLASDASSYTIGATPNCGWGGMLA
ncbi:hypothetical protein [Nitrosomonas eutropha]|nr:hypothetical protein [Nitrosomonas eutropha]